MAWLRTSIALISFGFAIARFGLFLRQLQTAITHQEAPLKPFLNSENLGVSLVIFGIIVIVLAARRYNDIFWQIERGNYQPHRLMVWFLTGIMMILGTLSIPLVLFRNQGASPSSLAPTQPQSQKR